MNAHQILPSLCLFWAFSAVAAAVDYVATDLGTLGGSFSEATDVNALGQVVGAATDAGDVDTAFIWLPASAYGMSAGIHALGTLPGYTYSRAWAINGLGQVAGHAYNDTPQGEVLRERAFLWLPEPAYGLSAGMHDLGVLGTGNYARAFGVNDAGFVVGYSEIAPVDYLHAFRWNPSTQTMEDLGTPLGYFASAATGINNAGKIIGWAWFSGCCYTGFLKSGGGAGGWTNLGVLPGQSPPHDTSIAWYGINEQDQVTGYSYIATDTFKGRGFIWSGGNMTDVGCPDPAGFSTAHDINESQQVVGYWQDSSQLLHAFLWQDGSLAALDDLVADPAWRFQWARSINDSGEIVGTASHFGQPRAFAATPHERGDVNCDGAFDATDVPHFVQALIDPVGYANDHDGQPYPNCSLRLADLNRDGLADARDVQPFVDALVAR